MLNLDILSSKIRHYYSGNDVKFRMREAESTGKKQKASPFQTVWNVVGVLLCVIFIPVIILNVIMIVRSYADPDHVPSVFGYSPVIVLSGSMSPVFEAGDMIVLSKTDPNVLVPGDIVCYMEDETVITHQIIEVQKKEDGSPLYITQGTANDMEDPSPVSPEQVQGIYTGMRFPGIGNLAVFLQTPQGMLIFIGGPILLMLLWDVLRRVGQNRREKAEREKLQAESTGRMQEMEAMEQELQRLRAQVGNASEKVPGEEKDEL